MVINIYDVKIPRAATLVILHNDMYAAHSRVNYNESPALNCLLSQFDLWFVVTNTFQDNEPQSFMYSKKQFQTPDVLKSLKK